MSLGGRRPFWGAGAASRAAPGSGVRLGSPDLPAALTQHLAKNCQSRVNLPGGDAQRWAETDGALAAAKKQKSLLKSSLHRLIAQPRVVGLLVSRFDKIGGHHQSQAAHVADFGMFLLQFQEST